MNNNLRKIVIVGGGTAGWMTAAALARVINPALTRLCLVESEQIGTVGVGEATIPHIRVFNDMLGINEHEFMLRTQATYKLGINFQGWGQADSSYFHPFAAQGFPLDDVAFHHHWLRAGRRVADFDDFSLAVLMAKQKKFAYPSADPASIYTSFSYAYHLDAGLYAAYLREYCEARGVERIEGRIEDVELDPETGFISALRLEAGRRVDGELFIDCTGFRALLMGQALKVGFEDWSHWLPCDTALAVPSEYTQEPNPYTISAAESAGWRWQIPLQHRMGNGHVYASGYVSDEAAEKTLMNNLPGQALAEPRKISFKAGMRRKGWYKNCVAIGLSSGFLEPLESTSIYLIQVGIYKLMELLPDSDFNPVNEQEFNRLVSDEYQKIRDFLVLHYRLNQREDSDFWRYCAHMSLPATLEEKIDLFRASGKVVEYQNGLFMAPSWLAVYLGQGLLPDHLDPRLANSSPSESKAQLEQMSTALKQSVAKLPSHAEALTALGRGSQNNAKPTMSLYGGRS
ncbi:tryptophan halogenase family protein [Marinimicrobium sp. ABcell2]|uniref:tryptophan halogenase family protein n=1 Tax=Marinimicrobium sp. ABcell2 TaxID=3069751 RepID=UPI0027B54C51|nr:tryptophan halogenase family protein [Marinimicrobium sp. ABcell2]MDQ2076045.1 tryptophan 7-halogenase [Marinimicrobium sp. ABcell2]